MTPSFLLYPVSADYFSYLCDEVPEARAGFGSQFQRASACLGGKEYGCLRRGEPVSILAQFVNLSKAGKRIKPAQSFQRSVPSEHLS